MKLNVEYCLCADVELPEKEVQRVLAIEDHLEQGHQFNMLAQKYNPDLWNHLDGEITGVYNPWFPVEDGFVEFENPDYDEVLWES